jgi:hypothetical protein
MHKTLSFVHDATTHGWSYSLRAVADSKKQEKIEKPPAPTHAQKKEFCAWHTTVITCKEYFISISLIQK